MKKEKNIDQYKRGGKLSSILTAVSVVSGLLSIFIVVYMVSLLWENPPGGKFFLLGAAVCLCQISKAVFYALALWKAHDFAFSSLFEIRLAMIRHMEKLPFSFFQKRKVGDLSNIIEHDVERIELYLAHTIPDVVITNIICVSIFIIVALLDWRLGIALVSTLPFVFILMPIFGKIWSKSVGNYQKSNQRVSEDVMEYIGSIFAVKAFSNEETRTSRVIQSMHEYIIAAKKAVSAQTVPMSLVMLLMEAGIVVVAIAGSVILMDRPLTAWNIVAFILSIILGGQFSKNFSKSMSLHYNKIVFQNTIAAVNSVMDEPVEMEKKRAENLIAGDIQFQNVTFGYSDQEKALKNANILFRQNSVNAIVGPSGAGKSTIANLIMGFWRPEQGAITIGGKNVSDFNERDLSALISIVQQDTFLFNSTIEENIRIGRESASREEIVTAAKKARIHEVIMGFPEGYQTFVGEGGTKLSGGEKQRIALARMILKDAPIVILDEATAAVDPYNEHLIQKAISNLCENKTLIMIAHHLNIVAAADQIVLLQDGEILANGTHSELLEGSGLYRSMVEAEGQAECWNIKGGAALC